MNPPLPDSPKADPSLSGQLKSIIEDLHRGLPADVAKARFDQAIRDVSPREIGDVEEQLIRDGTPVSEIQHLCDLHVSVARDALDRQRPVTTAPGHPVHTYLEENRTLSEIADRLGELGRLLHGQSGSPEGRPGTPATAAQPLEGTPESQSTLLEALQDTLDELSAVHNHYLRKENELFPVLERHGITGPPRVMWGVHDDIRRQLKGTLGSLNTLRASGANLAVPDEEARSLLLERALPALVGRTTKLARAIAEMVYKENKILLPMALETLSHEEWAAIRRGEDELGYAFGGPAAPFPPHPSAPLVLPVISGTPTGPTTTQTHLELGIGRLTLEQVDTMLRHLPVDLSFVDAEGFVRYYSETPDRLFPRTPGAIGRHVENCHPPKSLPMVREILRAFAAGERDVAEFWLELGGRFIHVRYFAVRNAAAEYLGCLEVSQDVTAIRALRGERRLLDWS